MIGIIVVFPKKENAINIRNLLVRNGVNVTGVATTGAQAMHYADTVDEGIVVCGYKLKDMMYTDLREYLPENFDMLLVASQDKWSDGLVRGVMGLSMPMMLTDIDRRRRKRKKQLKNRDPKQQETVRKAKELLMARNNMTEEEAHRYLQKSSMDSGTNMVETAEMVLSIMSE